MNNTPAGNFRTLVSSIEDGFYRIEIEGHGSVKDLAPIFSRQAVFPDSRYELWVTTKLEICGNSYEVASLADLVKEELANPPEKVAIVASNDLLFGLSRVYAGRRETDTTELNVFRDEQSAINWLYLEAAS